MDVFRVTFRAIQADKTPCDLLRQQVITLLMMFSSSASVTQLKEEPIKYISEKFRVKE